MKSSDPRIAVRRTASLPFAYVAGIHVLNLKEKDVDGRNKSSHDERVGSVQTHHGLALHVLLFRDLLRLGGTRSADDADLIAIGDAVGRRDDDAIIGRQSR